MTKETSFSQERPIGFRTQAIICLIIVNLLWGLSFPTVKALNLQLDQHFANSTDVEDILFRLHAASWIISTRFAVAWLLVAIFFHSLMRKTTGREWVAGAIIGLFFVTGLVMQTIGLATIPASRSGFLTSLSVVFTPLIATTLHQRRPSWPVIAGVILSIVGVAILTGLVVYDQTGLHVADDAMNAWTLGDTLTTIATFFFAAQILSIDHFAKSMNPAAFTPGMFAAVSLLAFTLWGLLCWRSPTGHLALSFLEVSQATPFWSMIVLLSIFPSLFAFSLMNTYQPYVTAVQAAVIYTLEPVFVTSWALFLPGLFHQAFGLAMINERLHVPTLVGGAIILAANVLALWPHSPTENETRPIAA